MGQEMIERWRTYLSGLKKWKLDKLLVLMLVGILLLIICIPVKKTKTEESKSVESAVTGYSLNTDEVSAAYNVPGMSDTRHGWVSEDAIELQLEEILQKIEGVGQVKVMITGNSEYNQIEGVVVVAEGADLPQTKQEIIEAVQALFPIAAYKVKVCKMTGGQL